MIKLITQVTLSDIRKAFEEQYKNNQSTYMFNDGYTLDDLFQFFDSKPHINIVKKVVGKSWFETICSRCGRYVDLSYNGEWITSVNENDYCRDCVETILNER